MNLLDQLARAGISWSLNNAIDKTGRGTAYSCQQVTLVMEDGTTFCRKFSLFQSGGVEHMLVLVLRENAPRHPVLETWRRSRGGYRVKLVKGALKELGEAVHTALRKLADSKQSVITWNAIHHLHPSDWKTLVTELRRSLGAFMVEKTRTQSQFGAHIRDVTLETLKQLQYSDPAPMRGGSKTRTESQEFALRTFAAACELTELDEWTFTWAGYLVEEEKNLQPPPVAVAG